MNENREVELKLETDPASIDLLDRAPILATVDAEEHEQTSTYFDTPEQTLRTAGLSLRVRKIGTRRIQTVKAESKAAAGLFARPEWEMPIDGDQPVIDGHDTPLRTLIPSLGQKQIVAIFHIVVTRQKRLIRQDGARIELVFDQGEIHADGRTAPICEIELELKAGPPAALFAFARALGAIMPVQLGTLSKWQRGYGLLAGEDVKPVKSVPAQLTSGMASSEGLQVIARACIHQFRLNQSILRRTADPEALHQARVALRRLRSALSIFREMLEDDRLDHLLTELRWIAGALDMARDLDVLLGQLENEGTRERLRVTRAQAYATAIDALGSARLRTLMLDLVEWLTIGCWLTAPADRTLIDRPLDSFAADVLERCRRHVKRRGRHWRRLDDTARHRLRIQTKKLRYSTEFFGLLFPGRKANRRRKPFVKALEALQTYLGNLNDQRTGAALLAELGIDHAGGDRVSRKAMLDGASEAYDTLIDAKRFWR